jgi:hypothetical protein
MKVKIIMEDGKVIEGDKFFIAKRNFSLKTCKYNSFIKTILGTTENLLFKDIMYQYHRKIPDRYMLLL